MIYRFAKCQLDTQRRELTVDRTPVHLEPQVFDVLRYLIERRDGVVSRDELVAAVWAGRAVSEATISARIWAARQAVGDTGEAQAVIRTLPRRGFRFVAPVTIVTPGSGDSSRGSPQIPPAGEARDRAEEPFPTKRAQPLVSAPQTGSRNPRRRLAIATAGIMTLLVGAGVVSWGQLDQARLEPASADRMAFPLPDKPSIAVLPFANLSGGSEQDLMSQALTRSLVNALAGNPYLFVISHSSTSSYGGGSVTAKQAAEQLGVRYIVEGSIKRAGNRVRVMTQLVDAMRGTVMWSERYQRPAGDLIALEEEVTARIARSLDIRILHGSDQSSGGTRSLDAWTAYVQGRKAYEEFTDAGMAQAREHYLRALEIDPNYAEAMVALAYTYLIEMGSAPAEEWVSYLARIEELEHQAANIAPRMPRLLELRSLLALSRGDYDLALAVSEEMAALNPNGAEGHFVLGRMYFFTGQYERAIDSFEAAVRINPHGRASYSSHLAYSHLALGRTDVAIALLEAVTKRSPDYAPAHADLAIAYQLAGRESDARRQTALLPSVAPDITVVIIERRVRPVQDRSFAERMVEAARLAGLPEGAPVAISSRSDAAVLPNFAPQ